MLHFADMNDFLIPHLLFLAKSWTVLLTLSNRSFVCTIPSSLVHGTYPLHRDGVRFHDGSIPGVVCIRVSWFKIMGDGFTPNL